MSAVDELVERGTARLADLSRRAAARNGVAAKLASPLADDAVFLRKLKPSLMRDRLRRRLPADTRPSAAEPLVQAEQKTAGSGRNPLVVAAIGIAVGIAAAKWIDRRGHGRPRG